MTTKIFVSQLTVQPSTATQGQDLSFQVGANNTVITAVTSGQSTHPFMLSGM